MMETPLVSVIMPTYNSEKTVSESIESVLSQTYTNWELIITDDCSNDNTCKILESYSKLDSRISFAMTEENGGAGNARNNSIERARGRYIAFLDSDDLWTPDKLDKQIKFMLKNKYALTYTAYQKFDSNGENGIVIPPKSTTYDKLIYSNVIGCLTAIYDQTLVGKRFMPLIRKRQDMGLWLDILKECKTAHCFPEVLAKYRTDTGMTKNKIKVLSYQWEFYRTVVGFGIIKTLMTFVVYAIRGALKSLK